MTPHQVSVAAESYAATLLAQAGCDVLVQYGANQPKYDLVAVKGEKAVKISAKGSQDGGWALAVSKKKKGAGVSYHEAIEKWKIEQDEDVIFIFVQFLKVAVAELPRAYIATKDEVAEQMKEQHAGKGHLALLEDYKRDHPKSSFTDKIPNEWFFSATRLDEKMNSCRL